MNIFEGLRVFAEHNRIGKLLYDANGKAYLFQTESKGLQEITIYPLDKFRPFVDFDYRDKDREQKIEKWKSSFDNIKVYSIQVGESTKDRVKKPILRYGFINEDGYAITHATYDRVEAFQNGHAMVFINDCYCYIDKKGRPILDKQPFDKAEFVFNDKYGFHICCTNGKYGLINRYRYLCLPCEYDSMEIKNDPYGNINYVMMKKDGNNYTAIIEGNSICNLINYSPKTLKLRKKILVIEEEYTKDGETFTKYGLLNRGGIRILNSEYDSIDIVASNICIVSKGNVEQLLFIGEGGCKVHIDSCNDIKYGEAYDEEHQIRYCYASAGECDVQFLEFEDTDGLHAMENCILWPKGEEECDKIYFEYRNKPNNYFAVVIGDKTKLVNLNGEEVFPLVIPSDYQVLTDTFSDGIVGISKIVKEVDSDGKEHEKTCYSYINSDGKILTDFIYDGIEKFENGQARAYYDLPSSRTEHILDKDGEIIYHHSDYADSEPQECNWEEWRDDAFEGDPEAYWNID